MRDSHVSQFFKTRKLACEILIFDLENRNELYCLSLLAKDRASYEVRWLKPVSTLERGVLVGRIDTATLNHLTAVLWYRIKAKI